MMTKGLGFQTRAALLIIVSAACLGAGIISPCLPDLADYFQIGNNQITSLISIYLIGYLLGQFFYAALSEKYGYYFSLIIGFSVYVLFACIQIASVEYHALPWLYISRFFCAIGASSGLVCAFAMLNEFSNKRSARKLLSLAFISLTLFAYLSITVGGLISHFWGWKAVFIAILFIALLQFLMVYKFIPKFTTDSVYKQKRSHDFIKKYLISALNLKLLMPSVLVAFTTTSTYLYAATAPSIAYKLFLMSPEKFGLCSLFNVLGLTAGGLAFVSLSKKIKVMTTLFYGVLACSFTIVVLLVASATHSGSSYIYFFLCTTLINFGLGLIYPSASYLALNAIECNRTASSIMNIIKIGSPIIVISLVSRSNLSLMNSFLLPLMVYSILACFCFFFLKFLDNQTNSELSLSQCIRKS